MGSYKKSDYNFRIVVVTCSILATVYYGYECAKKYISDPITVSDEMVRLDSLPPLQWSICKKVHLTDCTIPNICYQAYSLFDKREVANNKTNDNENDYYYYYDTTTTPSAGNYKLSLKDFCLCYLT